MGVKSKSIQSLKPINQRSSDSLGSHNFTPEVVRPQHFTEPDKRRLMNLFFSSEDILYFTYGLLYPQAVIQMQ